MRIAVTGRTGQVVQSLLERGESAGHTILPVARPELDLATADASAVFDAIAATQADVVVSAAAYTAVDKAESEPDLAIAVNTQGAGNVAMAAARLGLPLLHISTDYVFAGTASRAYTEDDPTGPQGVYGASKLAGEVAVLAAHANTVVLRTAWVISPFGANFVKTMLRLAETREELGVVGDQFGNPTSALAMADALLAIAANLLDSKDPALRGTFHLAGSGDTTWSGLAEAVFARSAALGGPTARVRPITTSEYPTPASRPANSRLDCAKLQQIHNVRLPDWRASLDETVARLLTRSI